MKTDEYNYEFVEEIPNLTSGTLYVSIEFATAAHLCACGCGIKVVTPLSPDDWSIVYNGAAVGLTPSIGNWSFPCRSHYWIRNGRVVWSTQWSEAKVRANREKDMNRRSEGDLSSLPLTSERKPGWRRRFLGWFRS